MPAFRTVLWIGSAGGLQESPVAGAPSVDLAWTADLDDALELPLASFDLVVMDAPEGDHPEAVTRLRGAGAREVFVTNQPSRYPSIDDLASLSPSKPRASWLDLTGRFDE